MESMYDEIIHFMEQYVVNYSEYGQVEETHKVMDKFYAPELSFSDRVTNRDLWYEECLSHPAIQDKLSIDHFLVDERRNEVGALLTTQAIERATGKVLLELKMNVLYCLKISDDGDIKIIKARVYVQGSPEKMQKLIDIYGLGTR